MSALPQPIPLEEAQARLLALASSLPPEKLPAEEALGRYLSTPLNARRTQPSADLSAMDGYALAGDGPWQVVGESRCGAPFTGEIAAGEAIRISTGAIVPTGSDRVLLQEDAARDGAHLALAGPNPPPGKHIRRCGFDFAQGDALLPAGTRIDAPELALAISAGHGRLDVRRRPAIAVLDSGDELAADPENCAPGQLPASNGPMIAALAAQVPCDIRRHGPVGDNMPALAAALAQCDGVDVLVTSGGASVGDHDLIQPALEAWGAQIAFWRVAIRPGKPLLVATKGNTIVLGLPGNPVSAYVTAQLFLLPLLRTLSGAVEPLPRRAMLPLACDLPPVGSRRIFLRATWDGGLVCPVSEQDSAALLALSRADVLIERPEGSGEAKAGTDVPCILLRNGAVA
ncbi:MAG: molybdopterin molybdotransferase MoeA [Sphingomonadales bacterium]|nr:molybdopterin molybdotransferase MoeA [Sphingomonadales bacterium]MBD3772216.1 molybdopterin molybdotransferase MoeA [Paracoccaceae bacterium]